MTTTTAPTDPTVPPTPIVPPGPAELLRYALAAAARGWCVFPVQPGGKEPPHGMPWTKVATTDPDVIRRMWAHRPYNIGIACGPSGLLVIDLDVPKPGETVPERWRLPGVNDGFDVFAVRCEQAGQPLPLDTFHSRTRRGGWHFYFDRRGLPLGNTSGDRGGLGWKIDTRGDGGYILGPGSYVDLPDGTGTYDPVHTPPPAPLPDWITQLLASATTPPSGRVTVALKPGKRGAYLDKAVNASLNAVTTAPLGEGNKTLYGAAVALGQLVAGGALDPTTTEDLLADAAAQAGQPEAQARRTIRSGFRTGRNRPRQVPA